MCMYKVERQSQEIKVTIAYPMKLKQACVSVSSNTENSI